MYGQRMIAAMLLAVLLLPLSGCTGILEREFVFSEDHVSSDEGFSDSLEILDFSTYDELEQALLDIIGAYSTTQTIRLVDYTGDVERDVQLAVLEVMNTPVGSFAVNNIAHQYTRILSYYEVRFDISYRRQAQDIINIPTVGTEKALEQLMKDKMSVFSPSIIFSVTGYEWVGYNYERFYQSLYYSNPQYAYGYSSIETHLYPDSGNARIIELEVNYTQAASTLQAKSAMVTDESLLILDSYEGSNVSANRLRYLHDTLSTSVDYDADSYKAQSESEQNLPKEDAFTAYGALIKKKAVGEGYALAFKQLCDEAGIECIVVTGKLNGVPHGWNMVNIRGSWSHIDCSADALGNGEAGYKYFAVSDKDMEELYSWDRSLYPECSANEVRDMLSLSGVERGLSRYQSTSQDALPVVELPEDEDAENPEE